MPSILEPNPWEDVTWRYAARFFTAAIYGIVDHARSGGTTLPYQSAKAGHQFVTDLENLISSEEEGQ